MDTLSYSIGVRIASDLKKQGLEDVSSESLAKGIADALAGNPEISEADAMKHIQTHFEKERMKQFEAVKTAGENFLAENKKREGVVTLPSGLQYEVITAGDGPKPTAADNVKVHYHGTHVDGTVFDSSMERGQPTSFGVTQVISGWTEALQLMSTGSRWKIFIPYDLAYGANGSRGKIKPFETLIFEVELLGIN